MREFRVNLSEARVVDILAKVRAFPWEVMPDTGSWKTGAYVPFMRDIATYWCETYDWRAAEAALNRYSQFIAEVDGLDLHFYHVRSSESEARPLLLTHGWPGSVLEFQHLIDALTDPIRHGGEARDSFHVVIPSLPGYGFSGKPERPIGPDHVATLFAKLMTEVLGYDRYLAQGGDWGAIITTLIGMQDPVHCQAIHLNMLIGAAGAAPVTEAERAWAARSESMRFQETGYSHVQMTRPQSLGFAMAESPLGVAAWIIEKFAHWSDLPKDAAGEPDLLARYNRDHLLTNVMIYLAQDTFVTSTWLYYAFSATVRDLPFSKGARIEVPTGVAAFPDPAFPPPPRSMAEKIYNIVHWTDMPRGGHFAAMEAPDLFLADIRAFFRKV
jgi:microsomal epoxide hydrolase